MVEPIPLRLCGFSVPSFPEILWCWLAVSSMRQLLKLHIFFIWKWESPHSLKSSLGESQHVILKLTF